MCTENSFLYKVVQTQHMYTCIHPHTQMKDGDCHRLNFASEISQKLVHRLIAYLAHISETVRNEKTIMASKLRIQVTAIHSNLFVYEYGIPT